MSNPIPSPPDPALAALARRAADEVDSGMVVGLGSGSTAEAVVLELGRRVSDGLRMVGVPTSTRTATLAERVGIPLRSLDEVAASGRPIDLGLDGADEIDPELNATKGRGGALLYEKLVALLCSRFILVAAEAKLVARLGTRLPLPVEVVPLGWKATRTRLVALGFEPALRPAVVAGSTPVDETSPYLTDGGHYILDCRTGPIDDPARVARVTKATTGVVEHGLFVGMADGAIVADPDGGVRVLGRGAARDLR